MQENTQAKVESHLLQYPLIPLVDWVQLTEKPRIFVSMMKGTWDTVNLVANNVRTGMILRLSRGLKGKELRICFKKFLLCTNSNVRDSMQSLREG